GGTQQRSQEVFHTNPWMRSTAGSAGGRRVSLPFVTASRPAAETERLARGVGVASATITVYLRTPSLNRGSRRSYNSDACRSGASRDTGAIVVTVPNCHSRLQKILRIDVDR